MTIPDSHRDLLDAQVGILGTIGPSGRPQLTALWFLAESDGDGDTVRLSLNTARQKTKNLMANPKCSLIITGTPPSRYIELRGDAEIEPDDDYEFADKVGAKYGANLRNMDRPGEQRVVVTIRPGRVIAWDATARS
ncbi:MAG: PPOX class F420-dependent oxidoreductase [Nocardiopsaceae bacterium]|nr:PPOX class F420-dependent oxidoreductase [Nocardiopsaceae bacterium]